MWLGGGRGAHRLFPVHPAGGGDIPALAEILKKALGMSNSACRRFRLHCFDPSVSTGGIDGAAWAIRFWPYSRCIGKMLQVPFYKLYRFKMGIITHEKIQSERQNNSQIQIHPETQTNAHPEIG